MADDINDFTTLDTTAGNPRLSLANLRAQSNLAYLQSIYGKDAKKIALAGGASLIGADLIELSQTLSSSELAQKNIYERQKEMSERSDISLASIASQGEKVLGAQVSAFTKGGVKLEGSALDVMQETVSDAFEAMQIRQREADFANTQLEIKKAMQRKAAEFAPIDTLLSIAGTGASLHKAGAFKSDKKG
jgi:hypothetical protein